MCPRVSSLVARSTIALALAVLVLAANAFAATEKVIYSFRGAPDGYGPQSGLVADAAGNLYGTTYYGGSANYGTVFELSPPVTASDAWTEKILYSFQGTTDGFRPYGSLIIDSAGNLHGTVGAGIRPSGGGIFELSPPTVNGGAWTETLLLSLRVGGPSLGELEMDDDGNFYGTTLLGGGVSNGGVVFEGVKPKTSGGSWGDRTLYEFGAVADDGGGPSRKLLLRGGVLYGTTTGSTSSNQGEGGIVFQLERKPGFWTETILYQFDKSDGYTPAGGLISDLTGNFYGVTSNSDAGQSGTIYELSPPAIPGDTWQRTTLYNFAGLADGVSPMGELWRDKTGSLYGITFGELNKNLRKPGTVYKLRSPATKGEPWTFVILHEFRPDLGDGRNPLGTLVQLNRTFYGTTTSGGTSNAGTVFSIVP